MLAPAYGSQPPEIVKDPCDYFLWCEKNGLEQNFLGNLVSLDIGSMNFKRQENKVYPPFPKETMSISEELQLATDLGLTQQFVIDAKLAAAQSAIIFRETDIERQRRIIKSTKQYIKTMSEFSDYFNARYAAAPNNEWYLIPDALDCTREISKAQTKLKYLTARHPQGVSKKSYDIATIKQIPIDTLVEVNSAGFFRVREGDKTPSCKWYKDKNTWHDFGSDEGGDVIDLYQKLNKCTLIQALQALSSNS